MRSLLFAAAIAAVSLSCMSSAEARGIHFGIWVGAPLCCAYYPPYYPYGYMPYGYANVPPPLPQAPLPASAQPAQGKYPSIACMDGKDQIVWTAEQRQDSRCN